jgi:hypothetical protein
MAFGLTVRLISLHDDNKKDQVITMISTFITVSSVPHRYGNFCVHEALSCTFHFILTKKAYLVTTFLSVHASIVGFSLDAAVLQKY